MQFLPEGTFIDQGVNDQMLVPNPYFDHPRIQRGHTAIQNQTMIFHFAGASRQEDFHRFPKCKRRGQLFDWIGLAIHSYYEEHSGMNLKLVW
jgi:hypothetical protein